MKRGRKSGLRDRLFSGMHPGLPPPVKNVPFGQHSRSKEIVGIIESELQMVVALVAAEFTQMGPVTARELARIIEAQPQSHLHKLVRAGWVAEAGVVAGSVEKLYGSTAKAWRELGLQGWSLLKEVA